MMKKRAPIPTMAKKLMQKSCNPLLVTKVEKLQMLNLFCQQQQFFLTIKNPT